MVTEAAADRAADVALLDGSRVHIRAVWADDEQRLEAFFRSLSPTSRRLRFFTLGGDLAAAAHQETQVDNELGLVAITGSDDTIVGHAFCAVLGGGRAEVALAVADQYQGRGLGMILLDRLAELAAARGIRVFEAEVLPENDRMLALFRDSPYPVAVERTPYDVHVTLLTSRRSEAA